MAVVRVPPNCGGMTLTTSGAVVASGNLITCTALEATALVSPYTDPAGNCIVTTNISTGAAALSMPSVITNITINGVGYPVTNGQITGVPAQDATNFIVGMRQRDPMFELVQG